jgi:hypothetical protein
MDLKDRYLNNKTTKYMLRADRSVHTAMTCYYHVYVISMYVLILPTSCKAIHCYAPTTCVCAHSTDSGKAAHYYTVTVITACIQHFACCTDFI